MTVTGYTEYDPVAQSGVRFAHPERKIRGIHIIFNEPSVLWNNRIRRKLCFARAKKILKKSLKDVIPLFFLRDTEICEAISRKNIAICSL